MHMHVHAKMSPTMKTSSTPLRAGLLQRKYACGGTPGVDGECAECRRERLVLQRRTTSQVEPATIPSIVHEVLSSPGQSLDANTRGFMESRFGHDFSKVRVHTDAKAAESAREVNALAYTVGRSIVFRTGKYLPETLAGKQLLAHELTHTIQQSERVQQLPATLQISSSDDRAEREAQAWSLAIQHEPSSNQIPSLREPLKIARQVPTSSSSPSISHVTQQTQQGDATITSQTFFQVWQEFADYLRLSRNNQALRLVPTLINLMSDRDAVQYGIDLAFWLINQQEPLLAQQVLQKLEASWRVNLEASDIELISGIDSSHQLIERAKQEARANHHELSFRLFGLAFLLIQIRLQEYSNETIRFLQWLGSSINPHTHLPDSYRALGESITRIREIIDFYPSLERDALIHGNYSLANNYYSSGLRLIEELRTNYILPNAQVIVLEASETQTPRGRGFIIHGAQGRQEIVTPLPGQTPRDFGHFNVFRVTSSSLLETLFGQQEFLRDLYRNPEIVREFGNQTINMNDLASRLRVWHTMYRIYQTQFPDTAFQLLLQLIERYLMSFTVHTEYNIRDFGPDYIGTEFPEDLLGRAVRDCGVYALTVAYEVYRTVRNTSPSPQVDFQLYSMLDHVMLEIIDRSQDAHYVVTNNQILGPRSGGDAGYLVARTYAEHTGHQYIVSPAVRLGLGSTSMDERNFRTFIWQRYQASRGWHLHPQVSHSGSERQTERQRFEASYQTYFMAADVYDQTSRLLTEQLDRLQGQIQIQGRDLPDLSQRLLSLTESGRSLRTIYDYYGFNLRQSVGIRERYLTLIRPFYLTSSPIAREGQGSPLARLGMALLYFESLPLNTEQQNLLRWMDTVPRLRSNLNAYRNLGRPPNF